MPLTPMEKLSEALGRNGIARVYRRMAERYGDALLKELQVDAVGPNREMTVRGREVINFGFDSFLGLDQDPRVAQALARGAERWGTQFGASRAFAAPEVEVELERKIARWMGTEAAVIFPSVTLTNVGVLPGLVGPEDLLVLDQYAHNSIQEGAKIARANGTRVVTFAHDDPADLERVLTAARPYRCAVVAIDGVYSMSGAVASMADLDDVARRHDAVLFVDDAHATAVLGEHGRGTVLEEMGSYDNTLVVGCLSKACSVFGAFVACTHEFQRLIKVRSNTYIFGGPVPPPYLEAISEVIDILCSSDYEALRDALDRNIRRTVQGLEGLGLAVLGGKSPIVSVLVGDEEETFRAGEFLFDRGYYVQSVTFPAVPYRSGVLRIQINANHQLRDIEGLLATIDELSRVVAMPGPDALARRAAARAETREATPVHASARKAA